ncbi:HlyD family secretion protein [Novosphingobium sp. EMRT-2]|uniref:HlyD family secretion protein n=1 Tax=Novosphingobium sp. EMRT-2 TaxID=2571749 RepID=UPI0010BDC94E|nr:HlyD family secretion protein [Novosphingobium sp. EMRT-2]QCI92771.1 HlyD family secretion protein [Novosphingobium sp. EMRT-2]
MTAPSESDSSPVSPDTPGENGIDPSGAAPNGNGKRSKRVRRIGLIALIVGAAYGIYAYTNYRLYGRFIQETDDAYVKADGVTVSSKLSGYVRAVNFKDNQSVAAGTLLVQIDPTDYQTRLAQSDAQVQVARATQAASIASIAEARSAVGQASAAVDAAQRQLTYLNGEVARFRPLVASGAEPKQTLDQFVSNRDQAASDLAAKQAALAAARDKVRTIEAQANQSAAQIEAALAQRQAANNDMATTRIVAPIAGRIGNSSVRLGQYVQPGQRLLTVVPVDAIYVEANFKETQIGLMRPGQPVTVKVDALPDVAFHGVVDSITPGTGANFSLIPPQNATGNFTKIVQRVPVRIRINSGPESKRVLVPGLSLTVQVDTSAAKGAIESIRREQEQAPKRP